MAPSANDKDYVTTRELDARFTGIAELIKGVEKLMAAEFRAVDEKLKPLVRAAEDVEDLKQRVTKLEGSVDDLELSDRDRRVFRRENLPALLIMGVGLVVSVMAVAVSIVVAHHAGAI